MILDTTLINLKAVLGGAVTTSQPECHVDYVVWDITGEKSKPATFRVALNGLTDVTILAAPMVQGKILEPISVSIYNKDTVNATVTVKTDDGTTVRTILTKALTTLQSLQWTKKSGWYVF